MNMHACARYRYAACAAWAMVLLGAMPAAAFTGFVEEGASFLHGTMTGHLLFGSPFSGFSMVDIAVAAFVAFVVLKLLAAVFTRKTPPQGNVAAVSPPPPKPDPWQAPTAGFDAEEFLRGAKKLFARLQDSWDKRDTNDIASFSTPAIIQEVRAQAEADPLPSSTQILLITADFVSLERDGDEDVATVFFDVLLRENPKSEKTSQVRELWHFIRPAGSTLAWKLDGIQQVD